MHAPEELVGAQESLGMGHEAPQAIMRGKRRSLVEERKKDMRVERIPEEEKEEGGDVRSGGCGGQKNENKIDVKIP